MNASSPRTDVNRSIGAILVDQGRLRTQDADRILHHAGEHGMRFGDAALQLGLISQADIEFALARQFDYPYLAQGDKSISEEVIAAHSPYSHAVEGLRALRTQLMLRWFDAEAGRKTLAIVSPERGEGRSWLAANLAVVFAQLGERTLLIDADLRNPRQHEFFKLDNSLGLSSVIAGRAGSEVICPIGPQLPLFVLPAGATPPNPQELLGRVAFEQLVTKVSEEKKFDVILFDTPAATESADAQVIAGRAGAAIMVARKNHSRYSRLNAAMESLSGAGVQVVGSVIGER